MTVITFRNLKCEFSDNVALNAIDYLILIINFKITILVNTINKDYTHLLKVGTLDELFVLHPIISNWVETTCKILDQMLPYFSN